MSRPRTPDQVLSSSRPLTVGAQFGVVIIPREAGNVEVATFRSDGNYADGRHPREVRYAKTPQEDVLAPRLHHQRLALRTLTGQVLDFVGGQADIQARCVRTIGDPAERFGEESLAYAARRALHRALWIQAGPCRAAAIQKLAQQIHGVSMERVRDES